MVIWGECKRTWKLVDYDRVYVGFIVRHRAIMSAQGRGRLCRAVYLEDCIFRSAVHFQSFRVLGFWGSGFRV